jgi:hypothetical protein
MEELGRVSGAWSNGTIGSRLQGLSILKASLKFQSVKLCRRASAPGEPHRKLKITVFRLSNVLKTGSAQVRRVFENLAIGKWQLGNGQTQDVKLAIGRWQLANGQTQDVG